MAVNIKSIFNRVEEKYMITEDQLQAITPTVLRYMHGDEFGLSTICSLYFDTPDMRIIRASIDARKNSYKEKLRLRCYGIPTDDSASFVELKKKYLGTVYKRRFQMPYRSAMNFLTGHAPAPDTQMGREVAYFLDFYPGIRPTIDIFCERIALFGNDDDDLRLTVDRDLRYRMDDLDLRKGSEGSPIIDKGLYIMEIKASGAFPLWLTELLDRYRIYPRKFSKYRTAFNLELAERLEK